MSGEKISLLSQLKIDFDTKKFEKFEKYLDLFKKYNFHTNLISKNDEVVLFEKHIFDSLAINLFFEKHNVKKDGCKLLDIGTGGGFPSLPIAILYPDIEIFAVDSTAKKINFIKEVKTELNLKNLHPTVSRIENLSENMKESFDMATTRALGSLPLILEYAIPFLKTGGRFIAYKSLESQNELISAQNALKILGAEFLSEIKYELPLNENFDRRLLIFEKNGKTPSIYPRAYNIMKKSPL